MARVVVWVVAIGLGLGGPAAAEPCKPSGSVIFEIDQRAVPNAKLTTATTKLYANGAWQSEVRDPDGRVARRDAGCLAAAKVEAIRDELRGASWKTSPSGLTCRSDQPRYTAYLRNAHQVFIERSCNLDVLDETSQHAIDLVELLVHVPDLEPAKRDCLDNPLAKGCN